MFAFALLAMLGGCNDTKTDNSVFDSSRLPRVSGAKEIFASQASTIFTSPEPVARTADALEKALAAGGWQKYIAPNTAYTNDPAMRVMSLKKGTRALSVFISVAPAQNNATSVQYSALPLKTDLPFTKDASSIEYSPERALLGLITAEPVDTTLDFYRKELSSRGWSLWSAKTNGKQPDGGPDGVVHEKGAYAHYIADKDPSVAMVLTVQKSDAGKSKVELKQWPVGILADLHKVYVDSDNHGAMLADVTKLPRLEGAKDDASRSTADKVVYAVPGKLANTTDELVKLLGADGWKPFVAPLEERRSILMAFKKGGQGLSVSFTIQPGTNERTSEVTTVYYSPVRLRFALPVPDDAFDIVFDENRPYLNLASAGTVDATRDFYNKQLTASGWAPLSAADATAKWPNAKLDGNAAYYDRGNKRPIVLSMQRKGDKTNVEIKVAPFALAQILEADTDVFGLPRPKPTKASGGTGGDTQREVHAHVLADIGPVLAFYRREFAARNWKEESTVVNSDGAVLSLSLADGSAVLKLNPKYDFTVVSLLQKINKPVAKPESTVKTDLGDLLKEAQQMMRDVTANPANSNNAPALKESDTPLRVLAGHDVPIPVPETAEDVEFDRGDGKLEFSSSSSVTSIASFYRSAMKPLGWKESSSVINRANMVVLNFTKGRDAVSFTIMQMGPKANVSANGSGLKGAGTKPPGNAAVADKPSQPATADDLIVEESAGLPAPKRHTLMLGEQTPFRHDLTANVPLDLAVVLGFYRSELGKRNWKEQQPGSAPATADTAVVAYTAPEGPALLKLGRKDGETTVKLTLKNPDAAAKAAVLPKPGQIKVLFGNINEAEAAITFNNKSIKVAAGAGTKAPDGPTLDLPPGKYKYSIRLAGKPQQNDELTIGPDETWGLMIGPGGVLALQAY
jgi:hypothetical protein